MKKNTSGNTVKQKKLNIFERNSVAKIEFDTAVLKLIVNTVSPYSFVENSAFIEFCELMINTKPITRKTLISNLEKAYTTMKAQLIETFRKLEYVSVTADLWTCFRRYVYIFLYYRVKFKQYFL